MVASEDIMTSKRPQRPEWSPDHYLEDVGHEEVHEGPQLHEVVLQRCAGEQEAPPAAEVEQELPPLALEVLDVLRLVEDEVVP